MPHGTTPAAPPAAAGHTAPLVGRAEELALLRQRLSRLGRGEGGIVGLVGEAGIGKSRLVAEALATAEARGARLLVGRSLSVGQRLSFHPFIDLLSGWAGIADGGDDEEACAQLERAVAAAAPDEAADIVPFIAALMGLRPTGAAAERLQGIEGEALERLILRAMRMLVGRLAAERPLVLFFEDVHWADRSSVQLLEQLLRLVTEAPVLFILALRPEHAETGQHLLAVARRDYPLQQRVLTLAPLDAAQSAELTRHLLGADVAAPLLARIAARAEGSPLFVEEVVRGLVDAGTVARQGERLVVVGEVDVVAVPSSVREVIAARLACLDEESRALLEVAAVIGRAVLARLLAAVLAGDDGLEQRLRALGERGLLLGRRTRRTAAHGVVTFAAETEYVFPHALVQETIYAGLDAERRRDLHARVAAAIATVYADRLADFHGMLAYHYGRAGQLEQAEAHLFRAGEDAARAAASREALSYFEEASRLYLRRCGAGGDPARRALLERHIGLALMNTGQLAAAMPHFDRALEYLGDPIPAALPAALLQGVGDAAAVLSRLLLPRWYRPPTGRTRHADDLRVRYARIKAQSTSDPTRLVLDYTRAVRLLNDTDPAAVPEQVIGLYGGFAAMFAYSGLSFRLGRRYLAIADRLRRPGHAKDRFDHDCLVCICNYLEGVWDETAGTVPDELVRAALRHGGLWEVNTYLGLDADRRLRRGDFEGARRRIDELADLADTYGFDFARTNQMAETTLLLLEQRRLDAALDAANLYQAGVQDPPLRVLALGARGAAQALRGDLDGAAATLAGAAAVIAAAPIIPPWHLSAYAVARLRHDLGALALAGTAERPAAASAAQRSARAARRVAGRVAVQRAETTRLTARLYWLLGDTRRAVRWLADAIAVAERLGALPELARAHDDAASWDLDLGDGRDRAAHAARASEVFAACGLAAAPSTVRRVA